MVGWRSRLLDNIAKKLCRDFARTSARKRRFCGMGSAKMSVAVAVGHVSGCGGLGIEVRKVRDGASKGQGSWVERWRFVVGNGAFVRWCGKAWIVNGWLSGGCNDALRMAYLDAGRGATEKSV